ncbi:hypothetical protein DVH24_024756 [Malus domestica]|uniref:Uncharacterized protein n=1 Tax=Malus domestica TaxID=3750 RepID=A0A498JNB5_MALDO|nr:hypothetical protein DVH24_024756 [Malus domestica]
MMCLISHREALKSTTLSNFLPTSGFSSSLSKIQSPSKISYFSFKPVSLSRTPSPLPSLLHFLDENDSLPSSSITTMSAVGGTQEEKTAIREVGRREPGGSKQSHFFYGQSDFLSEFGKKNPRSPTENGGSSYDLPHSQAVPASLEAQWESIRPESNAVLKSMPVNDESESRNVKTSKEEPQSPKKEPTGIRLDDKREEITLTKP